MGFQGYRRRTPDLRSRASPRTILFFHYDKDSLYREKLLSIYRLNGNRPSDQARNERGFCRF